MSRRTSVLRTRRCTEGPDLTLSVRDTEPSLSSRTASELRCCSDAWPGHVWQNAESDKAAALGSLRLAFVHAVSSSAEH